ncbi:hypothetical protein JG688_00006776, partial [Phytophthora aleatoria]
VILQIQALLTQDEVTREHSSTDAAGLVFEQIKSRLPFSSMSTKGRGRSNIHLTPIYRLPFQDLKSRSAKCTTFSLTFSMTWFLLDFVYQPFLHGGNSPVILHYDFQTKRQFCTTFSVEVQNLPPRY